jgi:hypothetical protein
MLRAPIESPVSMWPPQTRKSPWSAYIYFHVSSYLGLYPHSIYSFSYCWNVLVFILMLARTEELHLQDNRMNKLCKLCQVSAPYLDKDACSLHVQTSETRLLLCDRDRRRRTRVECIIEFWVHSSPKRVFWYCGVSGLCYRTWVISLIGVEGILLYFISVS